MVEDFVRLHPDAQESAYERGGVKKIVIDGKPREIDGKKQDYKIMLYEFARGRLGIADISALAELLRKAHKAMGIAAN